MVSNELLEERLVRFFKSEKYRDLIRRAALNHQLSIPVDFNDLIYFDEDFANRLVNEPIKMLELLDRAIYRQLQVETPDYASKIDKFHARVKGLPDVIQIREIRSVHLGKLIMVDGIVVRATTVKPMLKVANFVCKNCGTSYKVEQEGYLLKQPDSCNNLECKKKARAFELDLIGSTYTDYQVLGIQEKPEELPPGRLPTIIEVRLRDDLVDRARPGDRVVVTGILLPLMERQIDTGIRGFKTFIDAVSIETARKEPEALHITPEEEKMFHELAKDPNIHSKIVESIAPSIYGLETVKEAIMLLLFGGKAKLFPDGVRVRGDVNILLVGDPGTAKSALLQYVASIAPRGIYTSGRGSTAAGLTAAVVRDKMGGMILEAGAMVLADMGICAIDEIDKMRPEDRVAIHEAMATQTISVAKGGIVATLNARTSVLAAANPSLGRYDPYRSFTDNVNLPITILSRFDLIFVLRDEPNPQLDEKVSTHIVTLHSTGSPSVYPPIKPEVLKKYIAYAKRIEPSLSYEAQKKIESFYLKMRSVYEKTSTVAITARQLESLIRLAEARAKAALRYTVTAEDADAVIDLMRRSLAEVGIDVETGRPDIDVIMTGKPKSVRDKIAMVVDVIKELVDKNGFAEDSSLKAILQEKGLNEQEIMRIMNRLMAEGRVYSPKHGVYRLA